MSFEACTFQGWLEHLDNPFNTFRLVPQRRYCTPCHHLRLRISLFIGSSSFKQALDWDSPRLECSLCYGVCRARGVCGLLPELDQKPFLVQPSVLRPIFSPRLSGRPEVPSSCSLTKFGQDLDVWSMTFVGKPVNPQVKDNFMHFCPLWVLN